MNKIFYISSIILLLISTSCNVQKKEQLDTKRDESTTLKKSNEKQNDEDDYSDWTKYEIKGFGEINIPPEMEIQKGKFKELVDKYREINGLKEKQIVFQQKGMNEFKDDAKSSYARVVIKTIVGKSSEYGSLYNLSVPSDELKEGNDILKEQMKTEMKKQNIKMTEWYPAKIVNLNGMSSLLVSYKRQLDKNPEALVHLYQFHNNDRLHLLTLSYRITEKDKWEQLFKKILNSIKIIEIK